MILLCNREYGTTCSHKKMETGHIISADSMRSSNFDFYSCNDSLLTTIAIQLYQRGNQIKNMNESPLLEVK